MDEKMSSEIIEPKVEVVEKRVQPTVIRRRKKRVAPPPPPILEVKAEAVVAPEEAAVAESDAPEIAVTAAVPQVEVGEQVAQEPSVDVSEQTAAADGEVQAAPEPKEKEKVEERTEASLEQEDLLRTGVKLAKPSEEDRKIGVVGYIDLNAQRPSTPAAPGAPREDWRDKQRRSRRRKSRAELEMEAIQRTGGLRQFVGDFKGGPAVEGAPSVDRIYQPGSTGRRRKTLRKDFKRTSITEPKAIKKVIRMEEGISVASLSQSLGVKAGELIKKLMGLEIMATVNQMVDRDTATLISEEYGYTVERSGFNEEDVLIEPEAHVSVENLTPRAPVVTVMGHVDHGKTSVLDVIRKSNVVSGEAGGITQHIGAYEVAHSKGTITFIDTPGHAAFTTMRMRGAQVTDIVILVVAADDGIMPQTVEAIDHAKAAGVPIIVAINKIDIADAQPDRVKQAMTEHGLVPEDWGGDIICVPTSAKTKEGIDTLLDMVLLQAEVLELKADPTIRAKGVVIEAMLDRGRGPVATVLIQEGTLRTGDYIVCGTYEGKVRAMLDATGNQISEASLSKPVEILGLSGVPTAGDDMVGVEDDRGARLVAEQRRVKAREKDLMRPVHASLEDLTRQLEAGESHELAVIIKADVNGSLEAVRDSLEKLSTDQVRIKVLHGGVGTINESDVMLASASNAIVVGFNVTADANARRASESEGIDVRTYRIIYEMIDEVRKAMEGLLAPEEKEVSLGIAEVREAFSVSKIGTIAGCMVTSGKIQRNARARLVRDQAIIFDGKISSLKRFKEDAKEVAEGHECGIGLENFNDIKAGDTLDIYRIDQIAAKL